MVHSRCLKICLLLSCLLLFANLAAAEALRLLVPQFIGPEPLSQHVRTSVYFELIKAFRSIDTPDKGGWILYGQQPLQEGNHEAVLKAASWPSVRADLAVWGRVHDYQDGAVAQLHLTLSPLLKKRQVRPEVWEITLQTAAGRKTVTLDIPGRFYQFEPLVLTTDTIIAFQDPRGMPLYSARQGGEQIGSLAEVIRFYEIYDDAILISTEGEKGWVRTRSLAAQPSEAISFSKGMVKLLRGDWRGARQSFREVLELADIPQQLRIHSLLYLGLCKEKAGISGVEEFARAYALNRLDRAAAAYLLMSRVAEIDRLQGRNKLPAVHRVAQRLSADLQMTRPLFKETDAWYRSISSLIR